MSQVTHENATVGHPGDDVGSFLADAEALCRSVATRDLEAVPLYLVPQSSLPLECGSGEHCYAYTTPSLDLYLREHIPDYRGRGPCMVINDVALAADFEPADLPYVISAYALHELGHILDRPAPFADRTGVDPNRLLFEALVLADLSQRTSRSDLPAYFGHGDSFIRISLHLCYRAELVGFQIGPGMVCAGYRYGLSHACRYQRALGDEPERSDQLPFREILATEPPDAFSRVWNEDLIFYHQHFPIIEGEKA